MIALTCLELKEATEDVHEKADNLHEERLDLRKQNDASPLQSLLEKYYCKAFLNSESFTHLVEWCADCTEKGECNEGWLHSHEAKALKEAWGIANECKEQELSHQIELNDTKILQRVLQLPMPCKKKERLEACILYFNPLMTSLAILSSPSWRENGRLWYTFSMPFSAVNTGIEKKISWCSGSFNSIVATLILRYLHAKLLAREASLDDWMSLQTESSDACKSYQRCRGTCCLNASEKESSTVSWAFLLRQWLQKLGTQCKSSICWNGIGPHQARVLAQQPPVAHCIAPPGCHIAQCAYY